MEILKPTSADIPDIIALAHASWKATYPAIISQEQIDYMLNLFYNETLIGQQLTAEGHHFLMVKDAGHLLGYAHLIEEGDQIKLSKLYLQPECKGKGLGRLLMQALEKLSGDLGFETMTLNVNRSNPALHFYEKMGFRIVETIDIPLDKFWLNDYIMEKKISGAEV
ncbi:MAG: GNAT family N-acetyltransferase [Chitinophagaceae bacterium]|nr:GNAT family N-acetyltransferase [Chitinophagaceae bacterium]